MKKLEQKIFYVSHDGGFPWLEDIHNDRSEQLNEKVTALNSQGWKVESVFCVDGTSIVGFLCTKIS